MRNQNLVGLKLPELSEAAEQEKGRRAGGQVGRGVCPRSQRADAWAVGFLPMT